LCIACARTTTKYKCVCAQQTHMGDVTIEDADVYRKKAPVDQNGRVSVGKEFAGESVTIAVEVADDGGESDE